MPEQTDGRTDPDRSMGRDPWRAPTGPTVRHPRDHRPRRRGAVLVITASVITAVLGMALVPLGGIGMLAIPPIEWMTVMMAMILCGLLLAGVGSAALVVVATVWGESRWSPRPPAVTLGVGWAVAIGFAAVMVVPAFTDR